MMERKDSDSRRLNKNCRISQLDPFIESDLIRVGGRLQNSQIGDAANIQYCCPEREKYKISSLSIAITSLLMEVVGSLKMKYEELETGLLVPILL